MKKKGLIIGLCSLALVTAGATAGALKFDEIKDFANSLFNSSYSQTVDKPDSTPGEVEINTEENVYKNCGAYDNSSGEEIKSWETLLDEEYIVETEEGIASTENFSTLENVLLKVPASYTEIAPRAFAECDNLVAINLPEGITTLHGNCFQDCSNLEDISYPESAIYVAGDVFNGCSILNVNVTDEYFSYLGNEENPYVYLKSVSDELGNNINESTNLFHEGCRVIGSGVFGNNLSRLYEFPEYIFVIPNYIKSIGSDIANSMLPRSILIPNTVESIAYSDTESGDLRLVGESIGWAYTIYIEKPETLDLANTLRNTGCEIYYNKGLVFLKMSSEERYNDYTFVGEYDGMYGDRHSMTWSELIEGDFLSVDENGVLSRGENFNSLRCHGYYFKIPEGVTEISDDCFKDIYVGIGLPNSISKIGSHALTGTKVHIFDGSNLTYIGDYAFSSPGYSYGLNSINFGEGLKYIGENAFSGNRLLEVNALVIPNSVEHIGPSAFSSCSGVRNFVLPSGLTSIDMNILPTSNTTGKSVSIFVPSSYSQITFGDYITNIPSDMTIYFESANPTFSEDVSSIESKFKKSYTFNKYCFELCPSVLTSGIYDSNCEKLITWEELKQMGAITVENGVLSGRPEFLNIQSCKLIVDSEVKTVGGFAYASNITEVVVKEGATIIDSQAFKDCANLTSVYLPTTITQIGMQAFNNCSNLVKINLENTNTDKILMNAFANCERLAYVDLPNTVTVIQQNVFMNTAIKHFKLPSNLIAMGGNILSDCSNLKTVYIYSATFERFDQYDWEDMIDGSGDGTITIYTYVNHSISYSIENVVFRPCVRYAEYLLEIAELN